MGQGDDRRRQDQLLPARCGGQSHRLLQSARPRLYALGQRSAREVTIADLRASGAEVYSNGDGRIYDMGAGALLWEFNTKHNSITPGLIESGWKALELLNGEEYKALVIGNDGERFSIGANLDPSALMAGLEGIEKTLVALQDLDPGAALRAQAGCRRRA